MLGTVKGYIKDLPDTSFPELYQRYICDVQDSNIVVEVGTVKTDDIVSLKKLLERLNRELKVR